MRRADRDGRTVRSCSSTSTISRSSTTASAITPATSCCKIVAGAHGGAASARERYAWSRLGGDEFVVVLFDQHGGPPTSSRPAAADAGAPSPSRSQIEGQDLQVTCSMGVAIYPSDGKRRRTLLMNADAAMYGAKERGRDNFQFYTPEMNVKVQRAAARCRQQLRDAIARSELVPALPAAGRPAHGAHLRASRR